jgi:YVTN family beta-propeller protein
LPLTAQRPTASTTVAWEPRAAGNRVWVVNQDNNTASVFNAVTHAKIAEIAVGTAPRSVAVAPNGRIWVTNMQSSSISMIDPTSLTVVQTLTLPRASQPYGIVFFVVALIAAVFGFSGIAAGAAGVAKILFVLFLIGAVITFFISLGRRA